MADILNFTGTTKIPDDPLVTLEKAKGWKLERVIIAGWNEEGKFVFGGSHCEIGECILLLEVAKKRLLEVVEDTIAT